MNILILDLINLTELDLGTNNIKSIEALANKKLENLEFLIFSKKINRSRDF